MRLYTLYMYVKDLSKRITALLDDATPMERLNDLFARRFMMVTFATLFLQGETSGLLYALSFRDSETGKLVVQLLMDEAVLLE